MIKNLNFRESIPPSVLREGEKVPTWDKTTTFAPCRGHGGVSSYHPAPGWWSGPGGEIAVASPHSTWRRYSI